MFISIQHSATNVGRREDEVLVLYIHYPTSLPGPPIHAMLQYSTSKCPPPKFVQANKLSKSGSFFFSTQSLSRSPLCSQLARLLPLLLLQLCLTFLLIRLSISNSGFLAPFIHSPFRRFKCALPCVRDAAHGLFDAFHWRTEDCLDCAGWLKLLDLSYCFLQSTLWAFEPAPELCR